mmetsp:Transcript_47088/g.131351  ORF Transcript_47088/g.131351 Transcript_47088/m.131351 type:complete len:240 (-) Transcript_47088:106-825(-)
MAPCPGASASCSSNIVSNASSVGTAAARMLDEAVDGHAWAHWRSILSRRDVGDAARRTAASVALSAVAASADDEACVGSGSGRWRLRHNPSRTALCTSLSIEIAPRWRFTVCRGHARSSPCASASGADETPRDEDPRRPPRVAANNVSRTAGTDATTRSTAAAAPVDAAVAADASGAAPVDTLPDNLRNGLEPPRNPGNNDGGSLERGCRLGDRDRCGRPDCSGDCGSPWDTADSGRGE